LMKRFKGKGFPKLEQDYPGHMDHAEPR
jgi:hypothetical protein